jgi:hypothetical protein
MTKMKSYLREKIESSVEWESVFPQVPCFAIFAIFAVKSIAGFRVKDPTNENAHY